MGIPLVAAVPAAKAASPWIAPVVAGGLSALGSIGSSLIGRSSAKNQMRFQERMANTSHQRQMADLKKANINPLLTGKYGGASTPPGTAFTPDNPLSKASDTAINTKLMIANLKNLDQTVLTNSALEGKYREEAGVANEKWQSEQIARELLELQIPSARADAELWEMINAYGKAGKALTPAMSIFLNKFLRQKK